MSIWCGMCLGKEKENHWRLGSGGARFFIRNPTVKAQRSQDPSIPPCLNCREAEARLQVSRILVGVHSTALSCPKKGGGACRLA